MAYEPPRSTALGAGGRNGIQRSGRRLTGPGPGARAAGHPFEDIAPDEAAADGGAGRQFPFGLGRQATAGPPAPGFGLETVGVHHRLQGRRALQAGTALHEHAAEQLFDMRGRAPAAGLQPGPAGIAPELASLVAAVFGKFDELAPVDGLGVDLRLGHRHFVRPALVVRHQAARGRAQPPALRRQPEGLARGTRRRGTGTQVFGQGLAQPVLVPQAQAEEVQRRIVFGTAGQQIQRDLEGLGQVAAQRLGCRHLLTRRPGIGPWLDARQPRRPWVAGLAAAALHVACDPELLAPAGVRGALQCARRLVLRQLAQQVIARVDERQRKQLAPGAAHRHRVVERVQRGITGPPARCGWRRR